MNSGTTKVSVLKQRTVNERISSSTSGQLRGIQAYSLIDTERQIQECASSPGSLFDS